MAAVSIIMRSSIRLEAENMKNLKKIMNIRKENDFEVVCVFAAGFFSFNIC